MSPARRRKLERIKTGRNRRNFHIPVWLWLILAVFTVLIFINFFTKFWKGQDKLSLVVNTKSGDVQVSVFDPVLGEITNITIPGSTQVNVSRQLGTWKIRSVWTLGQNEKIAGKLLAETVTKNFRFPTAAWADSPATGFSEGNVGSALRAIFSPYKTNLRIGDRVKLAIFSMGIKNTNRVDINLAGTTFLKKARLTDGENGYLIEDDAPQNLLVIFSDPRIASGKFKVNIKNASTKDSLPGYIGGVLEVLGAKISSVVEEKTASVDCEITGKDALFIRKIAEIYSCKAQLKAPEGSFDMEFRLGEKFARRF